MEENLTVLENKMVGVNISLFRKARGYKAEYVADELDMSEANYLKYERGEHQLTIPFIQKVAIVLKVDPIKLMTTTPSILLDKITNSPNAGVGNYIGGDLNTMDEKTQELLNRAIESTLQVNDNLVKLLEKLSREQSPNAS
ncbi:helix-turn-helix domain-containing protein [Filimonas effusa]|uniref:XRE family transcriptional regulator n=1 Tax=Filimonas effusa TaxID=2508721 RepID=A0A4Q1DC47_9BACT|nr:helix-turn-helix transcriptional regulator [Filimonas effusa]RXK87027.1 XRE family transcriptional regulator [Filimonas effusa]